MANNPKKVKDPTEVALSAIQEALNIGDNIGDTSAPDNERSSVHSDVTVTPPDSPLAPAYEESAFETHPSVDRPLFGHPLRLFSPHKSAPAENEETPPR